MRYVNPSGWQWALMIGGATVLTLWASAAYARGVVRRTQKPVVEDDGFGPDPLGVPIQQGSFQQEGLLYDYVVYQTGAEYWATTTRVAGGSVDACCFRTPEEAVADLKAQLGGLPQPPGGDVGDVVDQGTVGAVQWRVLIVEHTGAPWDASELVPVYHTEFIDPTAQPPINQWWGFGAGRYSLADAVEQAKEHAGLRPWG